MKIAVKEKKVVLLIACGLFLGAITPSMAQAPAEAGATAFSPPPGPATAPEQSAGAVKEVLESIKVPDDSGAKAAKAEGEEDSDQAKIPDSVKGVVKRLNTATKDVTIEDLNAAREAVVKLDVLIDIEKRLNDLTTIRQEREAKENEMAAAIPESALGLQGGMAPSVASAVPAAAPAPTAPMPAPVVLPGGGIEVSKIVGASGRYVATVKDVDGSSRQIKVGDKLAGGSTVSAISKQGVTLLSEGKKKEVVQVKDISAVFGGR